MFNKKTKKTLNILPASSGESMRPYAEWVTKYSSLRPKNIFEIGANLGQDAKWLCDYFEIPEKFVWAFEPHPDLYRSIKKQYKFNTYKLAVFNENKSLEINAIDFNKNNNSGISSIRESVRFSKDDFYVVKANAVRMDGFIINNKISSIDFLKLDVEGCNYEVLEGFGRLINIVKCLHIEAEHTEGWKGQKLWSDINKLLVEHFEMVSFQRYYTQSDSFWIKKEYLLPEPV